MNVLSDKKCVPCEGGVSPLSHEEASTLLAQLSGWDLSQNAKQITKEIQCKDFAKALDLANKIGEIAEREGHHPDLNVSWGKISITLSTHAIGGLSENDFILAAKIDKIRS